MPRGCRGGAMLLRCRDRMKKPARNGSSPSKAKSVSAGQPRSAPDQRNLAGLQFCFFLSGAAGLVYQVVWTKSLGQLFGYSAYAVATVLAVFMGGMAVGSALFSRWRPANKTGIPLYAWMEFGISASALLSLPGPAALRPFYLASSHYLRHSSTPLIPP